MNNLSQQDFYEKIIDVLGGFIIVPVMDKSKRGVLMGRRELSRQLFNFIENEIKKEVQTTSIDQEIKDNIN